MSCGTLATNPVVPSYSVTLGWIANSPAAVTPLCHIICVMCGGDDIGLCCNISSTSVVNCSGTFPSITVADGAVIDIMTCATSYSTLQPSSYSTVFISSVSSSTGIVKAPPETGCVLYIKAETQGSTLLS
jgi:hypothetical protein